MIFFFLSMLVDWSKISHPGYATDALTLLIVFADLDAFCSKIMNHLRCKYRINKDWIWYEMVEIKEAKLTEEEFFYVYKQLASEAFLYGAESGSEKAGSWILACVREVSSDVRNKDKAFIILLDCGFTLYNLLLDVKGRYGRGFKTKQDRERNIKDYKIRVADLSKDFNFPPQAKHHLNALTDLIELANLTSTYKESKDIKEKVLRYLNDDIPKFLSALLKYHLGLIGFTESDNEGAKNYLYSAYDYLKVYIVQNTSPSAYCFNIIHGKY